MTAQLVIPSSRNPAKNLVICQNSCIDDAGLWKLPREYLHLPPDSLDVDIRTELTPRGPDAERWLLLWITARNPRNQPVLVAAPGDRRMPSTFGWLVWGPFGGIGGGAVAVDSSTLFFRPFETKEWLFDYRVGAKLWRANFGTATIIPPGRTSSAAIMRGTGHEPTRSSYRHSAPRR
jgi:hypothetical protein